MATASSRLQVVFRLTLLVISFICATMLSAFVFSNGKNLNNKINQLIYPKYEPVLKKEEERMQQAAKRTIIAHDLDREMLLKKSLPGTPLQLPCKKIWHSHKSRTVVVQEDEEGAIIKNNQPLLVLFTSFKNAARRNVTHSNTIMNWAQYKPEVVPVLFNDMTDPYLLDLAREYGWEILPLYPKKESEAPRLEYMFKEAHKAFPESLFIGFSNGDILFDNGLLDTIRVIAKSLPELNRTLIIGARYNVKLKNRIITKSAEIQKLIVKEATRVVSAWAEDYFLIARNQYPWHHFPDNLVIGRPGYDNFMVGVARQDEMSVVDASCTIGAMHQMGIEGIRSGFRNRDSNINRKIIKQFKYETGLIKTSAYFTLPGGSNAHVVLNKHH